MRGGGAAAAAGHGVGGEGPPSSLPPTHRLISHIATFIQFSTHRPLSYSNRSTSTRGKILEFFLKRKVGEGGAVAREATFFFEISGVSCLEFLYPMLLMKVERKVLFNQRIQLRVMIFLDISMTEIFSMEMCLTQI